MAQTAKRAVFDQMALQHGELGRSWSQLLETLASDRIDSQVVMRQLQELKQQLEEHFRLEEKGGYFEDIVSRAPHLQRSADKLRGEHADLLDAVRRLQGQGGRLDREPGQLAAMRTLFEETSSAFFNHESAEDQLLQETYCRDTSAVD